MYRGYTAPEYAIRGELSEKADIYSFGVLVLEIISSRKNTDRSSPSTLQITGRNEEPKNSEAPNSRIDANAQGKLSPFLNNYFETSIGIFTIKGGGQCRQLDGQKISEQTGAKLF